MQPLDPLRSVLIGLAGWVDEQQQDVIDYLQEENRVLRDQLGNKRLRLSDEQRRRLAVKAKKLGRKALSEVASLVTPDTLLASKVDRPQVRRQPTPQCRTASCDASDSRTGRSLSAGKQHLGLYPDSRSAGQPRSPGGTQHNCQNTQATRLRARAGAAQEDELAAVPAGSLGSFGRRRLLHGGGLDADRIGAGGGAGGVAVELWLTA